MSDDAKFWTFIMASAIIILMFAVLLVHLVHKHTEAMADKGYVEVPLRGTGNSVWMKSPDPEMFK